MARYSAADLEVLRGPHVTRSWFAMLDLPVGIRRLHNGVGTVTVAGYDWIGVTDPIGGQLVEMDAVDEPRFGQASAVRITLSGANLTFFKSVKTNARAVEGRPANLYWIAMDGETGEFVTDLKLMFRGFMTAPSLMWKGVGLRTVSITIESFWASQNFAFGGKWNSADQQRRYPGDKGLDWVGQKIGEIWR